MLDFYQSQPYKLGQSIADLIDNSYDAEASRIDVTIGLDQYNGERPYVRILDNGKGIPKDKWDDAMMLGMQKTRKDTDLGVFGVGLKLSSLSQANEVTVASVHNDEFALRRISAGHIRRTKRNELLLRPPKSKIYSESKSLMVEGGWSTMVLLEEIHSSRRFMSLDSSDVAALEKEIKRIITHLGLTFQRVLVSKSRGDVDVKFQGKELVAISPVMEWEKDSRFGSIIEKSVSLKFGKGKDETTSRVTPVIIPHRKKRADSKRCNKVESGYKKANEMQGLYIYRNERLIQYGGWNGLYGDTNEEHNKLGKILIDIPPGSESVFGLSPTKTDIQVPMEFLRKLRSYLDKPKQWGQIKNGAKIDFLTAFDHRYRNEGKKARKPANTKGGKGGKKEGFNPSKKPRKKTVKPKPVVKSIIPDGDMTTVVIDNKAPESETLLREIRRWQD